LSLADSRRFVLLSPQDAVPHLHYKTYVDSKARPRATDQATVTSSGHKTLQLNHEPNTVFHKIWTPLFSVYKQKIPFPSKKCLATCLEMFRTIEVFSLLINSAPCTGSTHLPSDWFCFIVMPQSN